MVEFDQMDKRIAFDTLAYVKKLREAGVPDKQAEAQAEVFAEIFINHFATKDDIMVSTQATKQEIKTSELATQKEIEELRLTTQKEIKVLEVKIGELEIKFLTQIKDIEKQIKDIEKQIKELELALVIRFGIMLTVGVTLVTTLVKLL